MSGKYMYGHLTKHSDGTMYGKTGLLSGSRRMYVGCAAGYI